MLEVKAALEFTNIVKQMTVTVATIGNKTVFGIDVMRDNNLVSVTCLDKGMDTFKPLSIIGHILNSTKWIVRNLNS